MTNEYDQSKDLYKEYIWDEVYGMPRRFIANRQGLLFARL